MLSHLLLQAEQFDPEIAREFSSDLQEIASANDILGIPLIQKDSLLSLGILFLFNLLVCWIIVHFFYYRKSKRKDYYSVLRWNVDNISIRTDPAGNIKADKEKSTEKIDGAIATIMALDRAIRCGNDSGGSVYDERGILLI